MIFFLPNVICPSAHPSRGKKEKESTIDNQKKTPEIPAGLFGAVPHRAFLTPGGVGPPTTPPGAPPKKGVNFHGHLRRLRKTQNLSAACGMGLFKSPPRPRGATQPPPPEVQTFEKKLGMIPNFLGIF